MITKHDTGLYVHYPYCAQKCPYCDFNVHVVAHDDVEYTDALMKELEARGPAYGSKFSTLYLGGGTPSEWDPKQVRRFVDYIKPKLDPKAEITLEANPGTIADERIEFFAEAGVNRLSIGAQSFHDHELEFLGRTHSAREITTTVLAAQRARTRTSIDLIYALPGQTIIDVHRSIGRAAELGVDHVSAYTLTIEPPTPLGKKVAAGTYEVMPDDEQAELIEAVTERLESFRYFRYEVSSYAPPGMEAVHNSIYWIGGAYLGIGAGAHSFHPEKRERRENLKSPGEYLADVKANRFTPRFAEHLDELTAKGERLMVGVRAKWGVDTKDLEPLPVQTHETLEKLVKDGLLEREGTLYRPTAKGFFFADFIGRKLISSVS